MNKLALFGLLQSLPTSAQWGAKEEPPCMSCGNHFAPGTEFDHQLNEEPSEKDEYYIEQIHK